MIEFFTFIEHEEWYFTQSIEFALRLQASHSIENLWLFPSVLWD